MVSIQNILKNHNNLEVDHLELFLRLEEEKAAKPMITIKGEE
jgi:hypothetical protein